MEGQGSGGHGDQVVIGPWRILKWGGHGATRLCGHGITAQKSEGGMGHVPFCIKCKFHGEWALEGPSRAVGY